MKITNKLRAAALTFLLNNSEIEDPKLYQKELDLRLKVNAIIKKHILKQYPEKDMDVLDKYGCIQSYNNTPKEGWECGPNKKPIEITDYLIRSNMTDAYLERILPSYFTNTLKVNSKGYGHYSNIYYYNKNRAEDSKARFENYYVFDIRTSGGAYRDALLKLNKTEMKTIANHRKTLNDLIKAVQKRAIDLKSVVIHMKKSSDFEEAMPKEFFDEYSQVNLPVVAATQIKDVLDLYNVTRKQK